ncbi:hypothetical protein WJX64_07110 [Leifsonia sp. YIM 134122]|uniref:Uncharacterized protein n=1 Tax=Leifsonia stereocauli TaxID=3134136 RepID=A0ABU9W2U1_9MICO
MRVRRGWFATAKADADQLRTVALGGRIGCVSALRRWGVWSGLGDTLHIQVAANAARLRRDAGRSSTSTAQGVWHPSIDPRLTATREMRLAGAGEPIVHWNGLSGTGGLDWIVAPGQALAQALLCQNDEHAIACMDSVPRRGILKRHQEEQVVAELPHRIRGLTTELTPQADSGWESIFITRVRRGGYSVVAEPEIVGVGHLDGIIEDCVGFEVNGLEFHSGPADVLRDTDRVLAAQNLGLPMISVNPQHIHTHWPSTWSTVVRVVEDARALRELRWRQAVTPFETGPAHDSGQN